MYGFGKSTSPHDEDEQIDTSGVRQIGHQAMKISNSFCAINSTAAMFSETDSVVKIVNLSTDLDWIDSASERFPKQTIAHLGFVTTKDHVDDATFSRSRFTKDDNIWKGLLRNSVSLVTGNSEEMGNTVPQT